MCSFETHVFKSSMNPKETSFFSLCFGSIIWKQRFTTISAAFDFLDVDGTRKIRRNQFEPFLRPDLFSLLIPVSSRILLSPVWFGVVTALGSNDACTAWKPDGHPWVSGCFSWMTPHYCIENGCFSLPEKNIELLDTIHEAPRGFFSWISVSFFSAAEEAALRRLDFPYMGIASELFECALLAL